MAGMPDLDPSAQLAHEQAELAALERERDEKQAALTTANTAADADAVLALEASISELARRIAFARVRVCRAEVVGLVARQAELDAAVVRGRPAFQAEVARLESERERCRQALTVVDQQLWELRAAEAERREASNVCGREVGDARRRLAAAEAALHESAPALVMNLRGG